MHKTQVVTGPLWAGPFLSPLDLHIKFGTAAIFGVDIQNYAMTLEVAKFALYF